MWAEKALVSTLILFWWKINLNALHAIRFHKTIKKQFTICRYFIMHYLHEPEERKEEKFRLQEQQKMMKNSQSISQHLERKKWKKKEKGKNGIVFAGTNLRSPFLFVKWPIRKLNETTFDFGLSYISIFRGSR